MVQNCNFSVSFLHKMEYLLEQANDSWHPNFRLWLVCNEDPFFKKSLPVSLLLRSLKGNEKTICFDLFTKYMLIANFNNILDIK